MHSYHRPARHTDCACHHRRSLRHSLDEVAQTVRMTTPQILRLSPLGHGPVAGAFRRIDGITETLRQGDVLIARDPFCETDPHVVVIGVDPVGMATEAYHGPNAGPAEAYRPADGVDAEWLSAIAAAARAALPSAVSSAIGGAASAAGPAIVNTAGTLVLDPTLPVRNTFSTVQSGITTANQVIDFAVRVYDLGEAIRSNFSGLRYASSPLRMASTYTPANAQPRTNEWRFELRCRYETGDTDHATYPFKVTITHDCFNIFRAEVVPLAPTIGLLSHELQLAVTPNTGPRPNTVPPTALFDVTGLWDPADLMGRTQEAIRGAILVGANGSVSVQGMRGDLVSVGPVSALSGPSVGACQTAYARFDGIHAEPAHQAGGYTPARGRSISHDSPAPADPQNGKHIFFASGMSSSTGEISAQVAHWWGSIRPELQDAIRSGQIAVRVTGHADPTGSESGNRALSHRRAALVAGLVHAQTGQSARLLVAGIGSQEARGAGVPAGVADRSWRRVTITLDMA